MLRRGDRPVSQILALEVLSARTAGDPLGCPPLWRSTGYPAAYRRRAVQDL